jgi:quinolinate synthase
MSINNKEANMAFAAEIQGFQEINMHAVDMARLQFPEIYRKVQDTIPVEEWAVHEHSIAEILRLKKEKGAYILAHNYQSPEIFHGVADFTGDSLALAQQAAKVDHPVIVMCGVHFMAETAKIINPSRTVLIPDVRAGCSLAESITAQDVRDLRAKYPGVPVVTYVNTSAEVKAETDICCTSSNAVTVVESLDSDRVLFIPDKYLAAYVATQTKKEIIPYDGRCQVHEEFTGEKMRGYRKQFPGALLIAHPECPQDVIKEADMVGSTSGMVNYIAKERPAKVALITECSMSDNIVAQFPDVEFVKACSLCPHMKRITLPKIQRALETLSPEVHVPEEIAVRARRAVERMLEIGRGEGR